LRADVAARAAVVDVDLVVKGDVKQPQTKFLHCCPSAQELPHPLQFLGLLLVSTQVPLQLVLLGGV
jgi:hypothetical protein